jgi:hypothetical protein
MFPSPKLDKLLGNLLSLPWLRIDVPDAPLPFYQRSLEIPEYHDSFVKHLPETTALYTPFWLAELRPPDANEIRFHVPEEMFYGSGEGDTPIPRLCEYLNGYDVIHIESRNLFCYPALTESIQYEKGVWIERQANLPQRPAVGLRYFTRLHVRTRWFAAKEASKSVGLLLRRSGASQLS